jgi:4-hydroxy-tetrahydrodipicolinate reductase
MLNGLPGNVARIVAEHIEAHAGFQLIPYSLTGPEITAGDCRIGAGTVSLILPDRREDAIGEILKANKPFISVDFTHPSAVNANAEFYCRRLLPFVMGTTGGDRQRLEQTVLASKTAAVIAPNMAKQIVGFQAMMEYAARTFPDLFKGYSLTVKESHQQGKADTSGTAKAMIGYFNKLGVAFSENEIIMERDPEKQQNVWGIPQQYLSGHGWHTYSLVSRDKTVCFEFTHNVNGRDIYADGTLDAVSYLSEKIKGGAAGKVFTMIDVLKGL